MHSIQQKIFGERTIGAILIDKGRLNAVDAEKIIREQKQNNLRFGDAAIKLGLLSQNDIQFALAQQFDYPYLGGATNLSPKKLFLLLVHFRPSLSSCVQFALN